MKNKINQFLQKESRKNAYLQGMLSDQNMETWFILAHFSNNYLRNHGIPPVRMGARRKLIHFHHVWNQEMSKVLEGFQGVEQAAQNLVAALQKMR